MALLDAITLAIAIIGCTLSLWNTIRDWYFNRKNIIVSIPFVFCNESNDGYSFALVEFVNKSKLPLTITRVQAMVDGHTFELGHECVRMFEYLHPERKGRVAEDSVLLPLSMDSLGYQKALFSIPDCPNIMDKNVSLIIGTNRGEVCMAFEITDITNDIKIFLKHLG